MRKHFFYLTIIFLVASIEGFSYQNEDWYAGLVVLKSQEVLYGDINYNVDYDIVQCRTKKGIKAFSPCNVQFFRYYDADENSNKLFKSFEEVKNNYKRKIFFELVLEGDFSIIRRRKLINPYVSSQSITFLDYYPEESFYDFYLYKERRVLLLKNFKKNIIAKEMKDKLREINGFISEYKLQPQYFADQIKIIDYYNSLKDPNYTVIKERMIN